MFLLSPANLSGKRGQLLLRGGGGAPLAEQLRSPEGAALGEVFSFVSSLYFRGKAAYAQTFGSAALVMTAGGGLCGLDERLTLARLKAWSEVSIRHDNPHFTAPLVRHATALLEGSRQGARFVLLGSLASPKYTVPLLEVFGRRLLFPVAFAGLGDMSRGSLLLKAVRDSHQLEYRAVGPVAALDSD